jgi:hypothetical protein
LVVGLDYFHCYKYIGTFIGMQYLFHAKNGDLRIETEL